MSTIILTFISLFCTYVTIFKRKNVSYIILPYMSYKFGLNFDKLKTNFAIKAVHRVKNHLNWLKLKCYLEL